MSGPDTIYALATAPARAAIGVVRLSGPETWTALNALAGHVPSPRRASLRALRDAAGLVLDEALVLWFPGPNSFTGEDGAELHLHGGPAIIEAVSRRLTGLGLRLAEPGEFTRRAFEHGRLDLAQAEAVADLVDAETEAQRRQALAQLGGALSARHAAWREQLLDALAQLEAAVDFPDEDLPELAVAGVRAAIAVTAQDIAGALAEGTRGERVREGYRIALIGAPNAGKSSLLNRLARTEAAIVTAIPGTTRDVIELPLDLGGFRVLVADTAGLREAQDLVEAEGVRRAQARAETADLRLLVVDAAGADGAWHEGRQTLRPGDLVLLNKIDLELGPDGRAAQAWAEAQGLEAVGLSTLQDAGVGALEARLSAKVAQALGGAEFPAVTRERHRRDLEQAQAHLRRALDQVDDGLQPELAAEDVRLAARSLARVGGRIDAEQVLDVVFSRFCIGK